MHPRVPQDPGLDFGFCDDFMSRRVFVPLLNSLPAGHCRVPELAAAADALPPPEPLPGAGEEDWPIRRPPLPLPCDDDDEDADCARAPLVLRPLS